ncbi:hypothetical protein MRS44_004837 [Fusarium solani]|uniref:uncharacterized protein n=1 Tax=Fusarium solani TaxID=169388 RepID=UPI0032C408A3|nr:hypothetical protein MRS44_004837 [Fusarium solani]
MPVASLTGSGLEGGLSRVRLVSPMPGAPAGDRGGVVSTSLDKMPILDGCRTPKIGEAGQAEAGRCSASAASAFAMSNGQRPGMHQPHCTKNLQAAEASLSSTRGGQGRSQRPFPPLHSSRRHAGYGHLNVGRGGPPPRRRKVGSHPLNGREAGGDRGDVSDRRRVELSANAQHTPASSVEQYSSRQWHAAATRSSTRWMMPEEDAEKDA